MLQFTCSGCDTQFNVPDEYAGRRGRCKVCSAIVQAPALEAPVTAEVATPTPSWQRVSPGARAMPSGLAKRPAFPGVRTAAPAAAATATAQHEPMIPARTRRLLWDAQLIEQTLQAFPLIRVKQAQGQPPELYQIEYRIKGLVRDGEQGLAVSETHMVEIQLTDEYPDAAPLCRMLTPIFHPNINRMHIGATDLWTRDDRLIDVVVQIGRMIGFQSYALRSALDPEAAMWAEANGEHLPVDERELRPAGMVQGVAP